MNRRLALIASPVAPLVLAACGTTTTTVATSPATTQPQPAATTTTAPPAGLGATINVGSVNVTLAKIYDPATGANQFETPDAGKRFVAVDFTITNVSSQPQSDDADIDTSVQGTDGQDYSVDFGDVAECTNFDGGEWKLTPGASVSGCVTFQLPTAVKVATVQFSPSAGFGGTTGQWTIKN